MMGYPGKASLLTAIAVKSLYKGAKTIGAGGQSMMIPYI